MRAVGVETPIEHGRDVTRGREFPHRDGLAELVDRVSAVEFEHGEVPGEGVPRRGVTDAGHELLGLLQQFLHPLAPEGQARGEDDRVGVAFGVAAQHPARVVALTPLGRGRDLRAVTGEDTFEGFGDDGGHDAVFVQHLVRIAAGAGGHEHPVHVRATRQGDVQQLAGFFPTDEHERRMHRLALRTVNRGGVAEVDTACDVVGRQRHDGAETFVAGAHRPVLTDPGDLPTVAVLHEVGQAQRQVTVVLAGDDDVTDPSADPVVQARLAAGVDDACGDLVGAGAFVEGIDGVVAERQHQRALARLASLFPLGVHAGFEVAFGGHACAVVVEVEPDRHRVALPQRQRRSRLTRVAETHELTQRDRARVGGDVTQHATGGDGRELLIVTDQAHHRIPRPRERDQLREVTGAGHARLIEHDHRARADLPHPFRLVMLGVLEVPDQLRQRVRTRVDRRAQFLRRNRCGRQPEHAPTGQAPLAARMRGLPRRRQHAHRRRLTRPRRRESELRELPARRHLGDQLCLRRVERRPVRDRLQQRGRDVFVGHDVRGAHVAGVDDALLRREGLHGRVDAGAGAFVDAFPILPAHTHRLGHGVFRVQAHRRLACLTRRDDAGDGVVLDVGGEVERAHPAQRLGHEVIDLETCARGRHRRQHLPRQVADLLTIQRVRTRRAVLQQR